MKKIVRTVYDEQVGIRFKVKIISRSARINARTAAKKETPKKD